MSFLESVLLKNRFYFICILDFSLFVIRFLFRPFHFAFFLGNTLSFVGLAKPMGQGGRDFTFQSSVSFLAVSHFFLFTFSHLEARIFESSRLEGLLGLLGLLEGGWNNEVWHARCSGEIGGYWFVSVYIGSYGLYWFILVCLGVQSSMLDAGA